MSEAENKTQVENGDISLEKAKTKVEDGVSKTRVLTMQLTEQEISLLRNCTSDLGLVDKVSVLLQLKVANAILDAIS